jgi:hypothetical protein
VAKRKPFCRLPLLASRSKSARPSYPLRTPFSYPDRRLDFSECENSEEVIAQLPFDLDGPHLGAEDFAVVARRTVTSSNSAGSRASHFSLRAF